MANQPQSMNKRGHVLNAILLSVGLAILLAVDPEAPMADLATTAETAGLRLAELFVPVVLGALFPDVDTAFGRHRKTLHNVFVVGVIFGYVFLFGNLQYVWIGVMTHYVLDYFGSKRGLAFFYPLSTREFSSPVGVPTSSRWTGVMTVVISLVEIVVLAVVHLYVFELDVGAQHAVQMIGL